MKVRYFALVAGTVISAALLTTVPELPAPMFSADAAASNASERVRIEHEVVRIRVTPASTRELTIATAGRPASTTKPRPLVARAVASRDARAPFLTRTVRQIVGDGRHTPQPFPRPGR
jgi:hypothetical protein